MKPAALTLTPHACPGDHPKHECGAYTACCSYTIDREDSFAWETSCSDCGSSVCEHCAEKFEMDDPPMAMCVECAAEAKSRTEEK